MNTQHQTHGQTSPVIERTRFVPGIGWQRPAKRTQMPTNASAGAVTSNIADRIAASQDERGRR